MSDKTGISWADATWNPVTGCTKITPGCANCYIRDTPPFRIAGRTWDAKGHIPLVFHPERMSQPLRWRKPRIIFVNSLSDLFHEDIPDAFIAEVFRTMAAAAHHKFLVLTKRPERMRDFVNAATLCEHGWRTHNGENPKSYRPKIEGNAPGEVLPMEWPIPNVWLGTTIESSRFTYRADILRETPAAVRFISAEPLLGSLFAAPGYDECDCNVPVLEGHGQHSPGCSIFKTKKKPLDLTSIDWLICGGESGGEAVRPMHPDWARELRDACLGSDLSDLEIDARYGPEATAHRLLNRPEKRTAFHFKQWGSWSPDRPEHFHKVSKTKFSHRMQTMLPDGSFYDGRTLEQWLAGTSIWYKGRSSKSGGKLLDGVEWCEMPDGVMVAA